MRTAQIRGWSNYIIYEDGRVYSHRSGGFLKPSITTPYGYYQLNLTADNGYSQQWKVHRLVLIAFAGTPPKYKECHHRDHDKSNNHLSNLEWVTHSENIIKSYMNTDREGYWRDRERGKFTEAHRKKMSMAKEKAISARRGNEKLEFGSIEKLLDYFGTYRKKFNRCMNNGMELDGWALSFIPKDIVVPEKREFREYDFAHKRYIKWLEKVENK